ncbi:MAG: DUF6057 family protein [Prevotella sp.]|nr:DUF6057 family protein [Prevotella sp.]
MKLLRYIPAAIAFIALAFYFLIGNYSDMLFTAQDRSEFVASCMFFSDCMARPFGLMQYLGSFLTQFFYIPTLGASILIAIWITCYAAGIKAFNISARWAPLFLLPLACLLASIVDVGYWIYCYQANGYWFSQSLAFLIMLLLLWAFRCTPWKWQGIWYFVAALLFPLIGWTAMLMSACMLIMQGGRYITEKRKDLFSRSQLISALGILFIIFSPMIWRNLLYPGIIDSVVINGGFPWFENSTVESTRPVIPFFILIGLTLLFSAFTYNNIMWDKNKLIAKLHINHIFVTVVMLVISSYGVWKLMYKDYNFQAEMRMTQAAMEDDWQSVLEEAIAAERPSRTMVMLKNIALGNTGELGSKSFVMNGNDGININNIDSLNMNIMQIAAPVIYYNYGHMNFAIRWCIENAIGYGFSPYYLRVMARSAKAKGEKELEERYTTRMNQMLFYKEWKAKPASDNVKAFMSEYNDALENDQNSCELYLIEHLSALNQSNNPMVQEVCLFYAIMMRDGMRMWPAIINYLRGHQGQELPLHFQEAYVVCQSINPIEIPYKVNIAPVIIQNYKEFMRQGQSYADYASSEKQVAEMMRENWGGTYWWYNAFGRTKY